LTSIYPLQTLGIGLGTDIYALPRLRLSAIVTVGGSLGGGVNEQWELSLYSGVGIGVAVLRWPGQAVAKLPGPAAFRFRSKRGTAERLILGEESPPDELFVHATVPASHSLEVEVGAFSGHYLLRGYRSDGRVPSQPR